MADMALAALIDGVEARNDWTDTRVVQQAKTRGHKLTTSDVSDYRHRGMKQIVPAKIRALAAGLELPPYRVALAVLTDHGVEIPMDIRSPEQAIEHDETLTASVRRSLLAILRQERSGD